MSAQNTDKSIFSLRLSDQSRKLLDMEAVRRGWTVGQLVNRIIEIHLRQQGFGEKVVTSKSSRLFEIVPMEFGEGNDGFLGQGVSIVEPKYETERAFYCIGLDRRVMRNWRVLKNERETTVQEVGIALLNYYNRLGHDLDRLSWTQYAEYSERRILQPSEVPESFAEFMDELLNNRWKDQYLVPTLESQDILEGRKPESLWRS